MAPDTMFPESERSRPDKALRVALWLAVLGIVVTLLGLTWTATAAEAGDIATLRVETIGDQSARVSLDGKDLGWAPITAQVRPGEHSVGIAWQGGRARATRRVSLEAGDRRTLRLASEKPKTRAEITVRIGDPDAVVRLDGQKAGRGALKLRVEPGRHRLTVVFSDGHVAERQLEVTPGSRFVVEMRD